MVESVKVCQEDEAAQEVEDMASDLNILYSYTIGKTS